MASRAKTLLTEIAASVAERLATRGSLKMVLSGAIMAFDKLSADEREQFYDLANGIKPEGKIHSKSSRQQLHEAIDRIKEITEIEQQQPGTIYRVLDKEEQKILNDFRKLMQSEEKKKRSRIA